MIAVSLIFVVFVVVLACVRAGTRMCWRCPEAELPSSISASHAFLQHARCLLGWSEHVVDFWAICWLGDWDTFFFCIIIFIFSSARVSDKRELSSVLAGQLLLAEEGGSRKMRPGVSIAPSCKIDKSNRCRNYQFCLSGIVYSDVCIYVVTYGGVPDLLGVLCPIHELPTCQSG